MHLGVLCAAVRGFLLRVACACVISYDRGEAPRLNCLRSHCLHHISSEAGHTRGSYTQTETEGSMCHWESEVLKNRPKLSNSKYVTFTSVGEF